MLFKKYFKISRETAHLWPATDILKSLAGSNPLAVLWAHNFSLCGA